MYRPIDFIGKNEAAGGFDRGIRRMERLERSVTDGAIDEAIRRGLQRSLGGAPTTEPGQAPADPTAGVPVTQSGITNEVEPGSLPPPVPAQGAAAAPGGAGGAAQGPRARGGAGLLEPVMEELAQVRGGGQAALGVATRVSQTENRQLERDERMAMLSLQRGDMNMFRFYGGRAGINLPDEVLNNAGQRRLIADGGLMATRMFPRNPQAQQRFLQTYLDTNGDLGAARTAAGSGGGGGGGGQGRAPRVAAPPRPVVLGPGRALVDPQTGEVIAERPPTERGGGSRAAAEPRQGARQQQEQMLIRAGVDPQEAARIAGGAQASANQIAGVYGSLARSGMAEADIAKAMEVFGPNWRRALGGASAVAPPAAAPPAPPRPGFFERNNPFRSSAPRVAPQEPPAPAAPIGQSGMQAEPPPPGNRSRIRVNENGEIIF